MIILNESDLILLFLLFKNYFKYYKIKLIDHPNNYENVSFLNYYNKF